MNRLASQALRLPHILLLIVATATGACADDQSITSPEPNASSPRASASTDATLDATTVTITPAKTGTIRVKSGFVELSGTATCSTSGGSIHIAGYLQQYQRKANNTLEGFGEVDIGCVAGYPVTFFIPVMMAAGDPLPERGRADALFRVLTGGVSAPDVESAVRLVVDPLN